MALSTHIANVHEKNPCSICGEMVPKYEANRHFRQGVLNDLDVKI